MPDLIYCAGRGGRFAQIAVDAGFLYGCRSDYRPSHRVSFADLDWKHPNLDQHTAFVAEHAPKYAVAPDVLALDDLPDTLRYAERLAKCCQFVIVVPKVAGVMAALPTGEPWLVVGYSVPTRYGGADAVLLPELAGYSVHLLGGTPHAQQNLASYVSVVSADGNALQRAASFGTVWSASKGGWDGGGNGRGMKPGPDLPYRAFEQSCNEVLRAWAAREGGV